MRHVFAAIGIGTLVSIATAQVTAPEAPNGDAAATPPAIVDSSASASAPIDASIPAPALPTERAWDDFHVDLTAGLWLPRVTGTVSADSQYKYDLVTDLGLSSQQASFAGEIEGRWQAFHLRFGGSQFRTNGGNSSTYGNVLNGVVVVSGDPTASTMSMWNFGGDIGVDLWRPFADYPFAFGPYNEANAAKNTRGDGSGGYKADLRLGAFAGARAINTDLDFANLRTSQSTSLDETWTAVYVGGRVTIDLWLRDVFPILERISVDANASFGPVYPGTGSIVQVQAGITMYPCDNFGVQFGYRLMKLYGDSGGQDLDANFAGLFVGGVVHF